MASRLAKVQRKARALGTVKRRSHADDAEQHLFANSSFELMAAEFQKVRGDMFRQTMLSERDSDSDEAANFCSGKKSIS